MGGAVIYDSRGNGDGRVAPTMTGDHNGHVSDYTAICVTQRSYSEFAESDIAATLKSCGGNNGGGKGPLIQENKSATLATHNDQTLFVPIGIDGYNASVTGDKAATLGVNCGMSTGRNGVCTAVDCRNGTEDTNINGTLQAKANGGASINLNNVVRQDYLVRRLTPLECERLQGFFDSWTDIGDWIDTAGNLHKDSDSPRYKALGNSIAIPPWFYVLQKLSLCCGTEPTMASLFDGIGGFPLIWEALNGKGSCLWASEIEEFPIAVTKLHFLEGESKDETN